MLLPQLSIVKRSSFCTSVILTEMESLLPSFEFFSSTSPDATIAAFELLLARTEFAGGLDSANLILFEPCISATSSSSLFPEGGLGGALPVPFLRILLPIKTTELVTKLIKLQQKSSNTLTLVSTTCVFATILPLSSTLRTKIDDINCVGTELVIIK
jgi:hypothetical protein